MRLYARIHLGAGADGRADAMVLVLQREKAARVAARRYDAERGMLQAEATSPCSPRVTTAS